MAIRKIYIGSVGPFLYDDTDLINDRDEDGNPDLFIGEDRRALVTDDQVYLGRAPIVGEEVVRLIDLGFVILPPVSVTDVDNPTELNSLVGTLGAVVLVYEIVGATGQNEYTLYAYDASGPGVNSPYVVDASGAGDERWIAITGKYAAQGFDILGNIALTGTVDGVDLAAFAAAYVVHIANVNAHHAQVHLVSSHSDTALGAIANNDLWQWNDPGTVWVPKSIQEVILSQNINPGNITMNDDAWIGIGAALERIIFDAAGDISFMDCKVGIRTMDPGNELDVEGVIEADTTVADGTNVAAIRISEADNQATGRNSLEFYNKNHDYIKARLWTQVGGAYLSPLFGIDVADASSYTDRDVFTRLVIDKDGNVDIIAHDAATVGLKLGGTLVIASAAELNTLIDNSMADALHRHSELSASDGTPDRALVVDAAGNVGINTTDPSDPLTVEGIIPVTIRRDIATEGGATGLKFALKDDDDNWHTYSQIYGIIQSNENGNEGGKLKFYTSRIIDGILVERVIIDEDGNVGIGTASPTQPLSVKEKSCMTAIGGFAIKLTNKTGANSIAGAVVTTSTGTNDAVMSAANDELEPIGVFLDDGVSDGSEAWVVVGGIADVAMEDNTTATRGNWVRTSVADAPYADATNAVAPGHGIGNADIHFHEIGHCIETVTAGGLGTHILARCVLHFN